MSADPTFACVDLDERAPELALAGELSAAEREAALAHLAGCGRCREVVDQMGRLADRLLLLAAPAEPPMGFESAVMARIQAGEATHRPRARAHRARAALQSRGHRARAALQSGGHRARAALQSGGHRARAALQSGGHRARVVLAVAVAALVLGLGGVALGRMAAVDRSAPVRTALAVADGGTSTCRAVAYGAGPSHLWVSIDEAPARRPDAYQVQAVLATGGAPVNVGTLQVLDGHGSVEARVDGPAGRLRAVRVLEDGHLQYEARFAD